MYVTIAHCVPLSPAAGSEAAGEAAACDLYLLRGRRPRSRQPHCLQDTEIVSTRYSTA